MLLVQAAALDYHSVLQREEEVLQDESQCLPDGVEVLSGRSLVALTERRVELEGREVNDHGHRVLAEKERRFGVCGVDKSLRLELLIAGSATNADLDRLGDVFVVLKED